MITGLILIACTYVLDYLVCAFLMPLTLDMHYFLTHKCATKIEPRYRGKIGSLDAYVSLMPVLDGTVNSGRFAKIGQNWQC